MKIITLVSSPRKQGNSANLAKKMDLLIKKEKDVENEIINLNDYLLKDCRGCSSCFKTTETTCIINDDREKIVQIIKGADGLILITPIYSYSVPSVLKKFIERCSQFIHRPQFIGKKLFLAVQSNGTGMKETSSYLKNVFQDWGFTTSQNFQFKNSIFPLKESYIAKMDKELKTKLNQFTKEIRNPKYPNPSIRDYGYFMIWKKIIIQEKDKRPGDFLYWERSGWLRKNAYHFLGNKPNRVKLLIAKILAKWIFNYFNNHIDLTNEKEVSKKNNNDGHDQHDLHAFNKIPPQQNNLI
ncbi:MAG: flavodoxin family protein [Candidatus Hodarchaeales archaeon]|jgi:multimeric flavodoxin WrbA